MADELNPFVSEFMYDLVTIVDDDDLKKFGQYSDVTLLEKFHDAKDLLKSASPKLPPNLPGATLSRTVNHAAQKKEQVRAAERARNQARQEAERVEAERLEAEKTERQRLLEEEKKI